MNENDLELLAEFRRGIPAPDHETMQRIYALAISGGTTPKGSRRSYLTRRLVPVVALAAVVFAIVLIAPWRHGPGPTVMQRALAAIGDEPVMHLIIRSETGYAYIDLANGRETPQLQSVEVWYDRKRHFFHIKDSVDGRLVKETLRTRTGQWSLDEPFVSGNSIDYFGPPLDPALEQFFDHYRSALASGQARLDGSGTVEGHKVNWIELSFSWPHSPNYYKRAVAKLRERVAVDEGTALPIRVELVANGKVEHGYDVVSIETLPAGKGDFSAPKGGPFKEYGEGQKTVISLAEAASALPGALSTGDSIAGLSLSSVTREDLSITYLKSKKAPLISTGVVVRYGEGLPHWNGAPRMEWEGGHGPFVALQEAEGPQSDYGWISAFIPPSGSILVPSPPMKGLIVNGCEGFLVKDGIYVHIEASSPDLRLAAARALTPIKR